MDIRRIPVFAEISKPSEEVITLIYANDLAALKAIDSQGNEIAIGGGTSALTYNVTLFQDSGATPPQVNLLEPNTLGNIVWSYTGVGIYTGTLAGAFSDKKNVSIVHGCPVDIDYHVCTLIASNDTIIVYTTDSVGGFEDGQLDWTTLKIEIFNQ